MKAIVKTIYILALYMASSFLVSACGDSTSPSPSEPSASAPEMATPAPVAQADAYAPKLAIPKKLPDDPTLPMLVMMMEQSVIPSTSDVNIPVYPGAQIMTTMAPMEMTSNGEKMTSYPSMSLLSADETAEVQGFYQQQLTGWKYKEFYGSHSFWNGGEDSNPLDVTGRFSLVSILPLSETDSVRAIWPEMRTRIDIRYAPPEG